jgi:cell division protein FtsI (penicillin-binding protein 3)
VLGYVSIDHQGQGGLEQQFDSLLTGESGVRRVHFDALRRQYDSSLVKAPVAGASLFLTIDESIQTVAETSLAAAIAETRARAGAIVVMDPIKGDVLAMASWPPFDPNERPRGKEDLAARQNYAISHLYEPGSTFKMITVSAALEEGLTKPSEVIDCQNGWIYIGRRRIRDHKPYGLLTVSEVIANSSNVGAIKLGMRLGADRLHEYVRRFGFGVATGIELPGEIDGLVRPAKVWRDGSVASISIGQEIGVTPLQVAQAFSITANGGYLVKPRIVEAIRKPTGEIEQREPAPRTRVISADTAAKLRAMMEQTVRHGTATQAQTPGYRVAGKTGTAQLIDPATGTYSSENYIASFAGIAPLNDPSIVTVIVLDSPRGREYYGGQVAAPVFPGLASQALRFRDVPPTEPVDEGAGKAGAAPKFEQAELETPAPPEILADRDGAILVSGVAPAVQGTAADEGKEQAAHQGRRARIRVTAIETPDFLGMTVREAMAEAAARGLELDMNGAGLAVRQEPPAGTPVQAGTTVRLSFGRLVAAAGAQR